MKEAFIILSNERPTGLGFESEQSALDHCANYKHMSFLKINIISSSKEKKKTSEESKTLFRNSLLCKGVDLNSSNADLSSIEAQFNQKEFESIDLAYYIYAVNDWSDQKPMKRTNKGWIATIRSFIRRDFEAKKLKLKIEHRSNHKELSHGKDNYLAGF